jgi:23S rRNA pseudouridine2605 synthase
LTSESDGVESIRLHKLLAQSGIASRRKSEELMLAGRVTVDGEVVTRLGTTVDARHAVIRVDGVRLPPRSDHVYVAANKPLGTVSTMSDPEGRPTLADLVTDRSERLFHVGRLDTDTDGLILLTNHGDLAHRLAHPSYAVDKTYVAQVAGAMRPAVLRRLEFGVELDDGPAAVDTIRVRDSHGGRTLVELTIHEGRNRIVRRMLDTVGHPVQRLTRIAFGSVRLGSMRPGETRDLTVEELGALLDTVDL